MLVLKGIIIRVVDYKEKDRLLSIATFGKGIITVNARGVRSEKAKLKSYANIFTFGDFTLTDTKCGYVLSGVDCEENFYNCWTDATKYCASVLCLELFEKIAREQDNINGELINLLKALREINYNETNALFFSLSFMAKSAKGNGIDCKEIEQYNKEVYDLIEEFSKKDYDKIMPDVRIDLALEGIKLLNLLFKNYLNINIKSINEILKLL